MGIFVVILLVIAAVCFFAGIFNTGQPRYSAVSAGLFFAAVAWIIERLGG